jgi:hypothetical protein
MRKIVRAARSRHGILGILGNHDYAEEAPELEAMGVRMLMNAAVENPGRERQRVGRWSRRRLGLRLRRPAARLSGISAATPTRDKSECR